MEGSMSVPMVLKPILTLLAFFILTTSCAENDCKGTSWNYASSPENSCPENFNEIYKKVDFHGYEYKYCCKEGSEGEKKAKVEAVNDCRSNQCMPVSMGDPCSKIRVFAEQYVDGNKLEYDQVIGDYCEIPGYPERGFEALCCVKNSTQILLMSTQGAELHEFPHMARLTVGNEMCGGTIYNKRYIITASHCITETRSTVVKDASIMTVRLGVNNAGNSEHEYSVKRAIRHEEYSGLPAQPVPGQADNDIALLELDRDIEWSDKIKAMEIAPKGFVPLEYADLSVFAGWGLTRTGETSGSLKKGNALIWGDEQCFGPDGRWNGNGFEERVFCIGGILNGRWSPNTPSRGDSGGPSICRGEDGRAVLCGVTSQGGDDDACWENLDAADCKPVIYTEVAFYHDWIKSHAGEQDPESLYKPFLYGERVEEGQYEHQVHITSDSGKSCGGTLVAPDVVVTAAQCVVKLDGSMHSNLKVVTGIRKLGSNHGIEFGVKTVKAMPGFEEVPLDVEKLNRLRDRAKVTIADDRYKNDLAIVKLDKSTSISEDKLPSLPEEEKNEFSLGMEISFPRNISKPQAQGGLLMSREFRLLDDDQCQKRLNWLSSVNLDVELDKNVLCGVEKYVGGSMCDRELGGGLICEDGGKEVLCGVQSFRLCQFALPNAFVDVARQTGWLKEEMNNL